MSIPDYHVIVSTNVQVRLDGLPYSNQSEAERPGRCGLWYGTDKLKRRCMAVDKYDRVADNLAAIAATLEHMRGIERHGGAEILERAFLGFQALPEPEQWWKVLGFDLAPKTRQEAEDAFKSLAKVHHPDVGGDAGKFSRIASAIERARQVLI